MPCTVIKSGDLTAIVCTRGQRKPPRCRWCRKPGTLLCDGPARKGGGTCDARICPDHATNVGPDRDLCPTCAKGPQQGELFGGHGA